MEHLELALAFAERSLERVEASFRAEAERIIREVIKLTSAELGGLLKVIAAGPDALACDTAEVLACTDIEWWSERIREFYKMLPDAGRPRATHFAALNAVLAARRCDDAGLLARAAGSLAELRLATLYPDWWEEAVSARARSELSRIGILARHGDHEARERDVLADHEKWNMGGWPFRKTYKPTGHTVKSFKDAAATEYGISVESVGRYLRKAGRTRPRIRA